VSMNFFNQKQYRPLPQQHLFTGMRAEQPVTHMRSTNSKPQPSKHPINSPKTKSSPALHLFLFQKPETVQKKTSNSTGKKCKNVTYYSKKILL